MGQDDQGRPFYAMRFIRGETLREAIRRFHAEAEPAHDFSRNSLNFRRLLNRFVDVCNAIAFAHDRGVLHRDMKPENIMLGKFGETLVVDWGMARVMGQPLAVDQSEESILRPATPTHLSVTQEGSALGTPAYMSPEVAVGKLDQVGPASDIFSLGATLYCLLTNRPPLQADSLSELLRKAERCDFPPPNIVNPRTPKALSAICCRAMALDATSRYSTPLELAADIERWLGDEAVSAYQEPLGERLFRWVRRHRTWALAAAASICIITLVTLIAAGLINESRRQAVMLAEANAKLADSEKTARDEAVRRFTESRRTVDKWLTGFTEAVEYYPGVQSFRDRMLQQAAENYSQFAKQGSKDPDLELERGRTLVRLGDLRRTLLQSAAAGEAYAEAENVFSSLPTLGTSRGAATLESANVTVRKGILATEVGDFDAAEKHYAQALATLQSLEASELDHERVTLNLVDAHTAYGALLSNRGDQSAAEQQLRRAIELQSGLTRTTPADLKLVGPLSNARVRLGQLLLQRGAAREALEEFSQAVTHWDRLVDLEPDHPEPLQSRAAAQINLASALRLLGRYSKEAECYRAAISDYEALQKAMPDVPVYRENLALTETDLGQLLIELGRPKEASNVLIKARDQLVQLADTYRDVVRFQEATAVSLDNLGQAQLDLGLLSESLESHQAAGELLSRLADAWPLIVAYQERSAICRSHLGEVQAAMGKIDSAIESFGVAIGQLAKLSALHPDLVSTSSALATVRAHLGDVQLEKGQSRKAKEAFAEASQIWQMIVMQSPTAEYYHRAARFYTFRPNDQIADENLGLDYARRAFEAAPENGVYLGTLAAAQLRVGDTQGALDSLDRCAAMEDTDRGRDLLFRALCKIQIKHREEAIAALDVARTWIAENRPGSLQLKRLAKEVTEHVSDTK
jgi:serine/threonine-protein kinase